MTGSMANRSVTTCFRMEKFVPFRGTFTARAACAVLALLVVAGTARNASADSITETLDTGLQLTDLNNIPLTLQLFNSNLGTLTGITITESGTVNASGSVVNSATSAKSFTLLQDTQFSLTDTTGTLTPYLSTLNLDPTVSQVYTNAVPHTSYAFTPPSTNAQLSDSVSSAYYSAFSKAGGGTDTVNVSTTTTDVVRGGGGNVTTAINTYARDQVTVTYTYKTLAPAPVPALAGTFPGLLLGGAGVFRKLFRRPRVNV